MKKTLPALVVVLAMLSSLHSRPAEHPVAPTPLVQAHSHNDYEQARPLVAALENGFCSIEADIYLVNGRLLVAHDRDKVKAERTLEALYLEPLRERIERNGGRVYRGGPPVSLLIDVKSEAEDTYLVLRDVLRRYTNILTRFSGPLTVTNALTAIISGNRARNLMASEPVRFAALDGRPEDLDGSAPKELIAWISEDWTRLFQWRGRGPFPPAEKERLRQLVERAHAQGRKVRFWGTPDRPEMWRELLNAGVDLINADDLPGLREFLTKPHPAG